MGATLEGIVGQTHSGAPRSAAALGAALRDARGHTLRLYAHLTEREQQFPRLPTVNPPRWEVGHIGWFQEFWCRRYTTADPRGVASPPRLAGADAWLDSRTVPHDIRWDLPIPDWDGIHAYLRDTLDDTLTALSRTRDGERYFFELALYHEDMHGEALLMTLQSLALPRPPNLERRRDRPQGDGDVSLAGGAFMMGTAHSEDGRFVFDNEKHAHEVALAPFAIARRCVTEGEFTAFVDDGGYLRSELWNPAGRAWLATAGRHMPAYWRRAGGGFEVREFDRWRALEPARTLCNVNAYEAEAWCAWSGRRLPTESEWEAAAVHGLLATPGDVWEWTASPFVPYPGFTADPYEEYSQPWFHDHRALRGGSWATAPRLVHPRFRNFYLPERHDAFAGFRSCAAR